MKNLARITHHANKVENGPSSGDRRRLPVCAQPDCRRRVMAMPAGAPTPAHCYGHATDAERAQYHQAWEPQTSQAPTAASFPVGMRVQSASVRLPHPVGTVRTHFGEVTGASKDGWVLVRWDGCEQEDEMSPSELEPERPCPHPESRRYAWMAYNHESDRTDMLCVVCCDCGAVLHTGAVKGAAKGKERK